MDPESNATSLICQFFIGPLRSNPQFIEDIAANVNLESMDNDEVINIPDGSEEGRYLYLKTYTDGRTKFIRFSDDEDVEPEESDFVASTGLDINIKELGFSVISQISKFERKEIAYIFMKDIVFQMLDTPKHKRINFSIETFQIDNQINYNILFPVMFRPNSRKRKKTAIDFSILMRNGTGDAVFIESAKMSI